MLRKTLVPIGQEEHYRREGSPGLSKVGLFKEERERQSSWSRASEAGRCSGAVNGRWSGWGGQGCGCCRQSSPTGADGGSSEQGGGRGRGQS